MSVRPNRLVLGTEVRLVQHRTGLQTSVRSEGHNGDMMHAHASHACVPAAGPGDR